MPSPSEPLIDERFRELAALLRDARPRPSERLREQVRELALAPPAAPAHRLRVRRLVPLAIAVAVTAALAGGAVLLSTRGGGEAAPDASFGAESAPANGAARSQKAAPPAADRSRALTTLPPATGRAQEYRAELSVRVRDVAALSGTTSRAMRITRSLGGYVVSASFDDPGDAEGDSRLVVRVPVGRVQEAIQRFSQLGTILAQHISVADLQAQLDRQADAIAALRARIARLETQLADTTLSAEARERIRLQLLDARRTLTARAGGRAQTKRRAATARVALTLTTRTQAEPVVPAPKDDGLGGTLRDALRLLAAAMVWTLAALIVGSPLLVLLALLALGLRMRRRSEERRFLERAPAS